MIDAVGLSPPAARSGDHASPCTHAHTGFTLIELVTVLTIFGLMAFIAMPRFPHAETLDDQDRLIEWISRQNERLRYQSTRLGQPFALNISLAAQRLWITHAAMTEDQLDQAVAHGVELPPDVHIEQVTFPLDDQRSTEPAAVIRFFPKGISDMADIDIHADGRPGRRIRIEPFLVTLIADPEDDNP